MLPTTRHADLISAKVEENAITLIIGDTGCGKSTQVPRILTDHLAGTVLCTQPRRLAVLGVANRVSEEMGEELGGTVGYHVGCQHIGNDGETRLVFATAGVIFERIKKEGACALARHAAVIVDEVHERSVENDLLLACIRRLLPTLGPDFRLVLMSATADVYRLRSFFGEQTRGAPTRLEVVALSANVAVWNVTEKYLSQALDHATTQSGGAALADGSAERLRARIGQLVGEPGELAELFPLIARLCVRLLLQEGRRGAAASAGGGGDAGSGSTVLVFLPTWSTLEAVYKLLLQSLPLGTPLHLLHSSIDQDDALAAMAGDGGRTPRVVLASAIAESSVTIDGVGHVIDSCRACEVYWSAASNSSHSKLTWVSHSQAQQRRGRTGRVCHGTVWRLLPRAFYRDELDPYEMPVVRLVPLRKECLGLTTAVDRALSDAAATLGATIDPPSPRHVEGAFSRLMQMGLVTEAQAAPAHRGRQARRPEAGRFVATPLGSLIEALPVDLEASLFVLHACRAQLLPEAALLAALRCTTPLVLLRRPLETHAYDALVARFGPSRGAAAGLSPADCGLLANLAAFQYPTACQLPYHATTC